jgi:uncharacterized OsmC-like protein
MVITAEECSELTQVCMKALRFIETKGDLDDDTRQKIIEEAGDVLCMLELLVRHGIVKWNDLYERSEVKKEKLKTWSRLI